MVDVWLLCGCNLKLFFVFCFKLEIGSGEKKEDSKDTVEGVYIGIRRGVQR